MDQLIRVAFRPMILSTQKTIRASSINLYNTFNTLIKIYKKAAVWYFSRFGPALEMYGVYLMVSGRN